MTEMEIRTFIDSVKNGTIHTMQFVRKLKTKKNVTDDLAKVETVQVSFGVDYDNKKAVIEARSNGQLPTENQGLAKNLEWVMFPFLIKNIITGEIQLRCNGLNTKKHEISYFKNGIQVAPAEIVNDCYANEVHLTLPTPRPTFNIALDKILTII